MVSPLAVSFGIGTSGQITSLRGNIRLAAHFGIFQSGMTALGWLAGGTIVQFVKGFDHWIAFALLGYVGVSLLRSGFNKDGKTAASHKGYCELHYAAVLERTHTWYWKHGGKERKQQYNIAKKT